MPRKRAVIAVGLLAGLGLLGGGAAWLLMHQPGFYRAALQSELPPDERREQARQFEKSTVELVNDIRHEERWAQEFSEQAVNSWLADELPTRFAEWLPEGVQSPRVKFVPDGLWIAFRTQHGAWSGVISSKARVWVASPNSLAIEIRSLNAGMLPIPVDEAVGDFVEGLNAKGWRAEWKRSSRGDALLLSLDDALSDDSSERPVLEAIELSAGRLRVSGRRQSPVRTAHKPTGSRSANMPTGSRSQDDVSSDRESSTK
ncbi:MAG: hypothetical protein EXS05_00835 [Planctomycetaceae bacterium]|nr:hypothetical protein [Planctomycetaceae bacterium]